MSHERPPYNPGDVVGSKYQLVKVLGEGGMSVVYDAVDTTCERKVAVKVIRPDHAGRGGFSRERMQREAAVLVKLHEQTEFVVDVLTSGITDDEYQLPYYVMERLRGDTLRQFMADQLARDVDFTMDEIAGVGVPIAVALAHAHALGVVHRDTKPENVFMAVTHDGRAAIKVLDFGICARADDEHHAGMFAGTLAYAAPEQLEGKPPVPETDVYALGLILFEMATLKLPHGRHRDDLGLERLSLAVMKNPVPDVATLRLDTPRSFAELVGRCLALDPKQRPSAQEVARVLRDIRLSFLGSLSGATVSQTAATDVTGTPIAVLQAQLAAASEAARPREVRVVGGSNVVDLSAPTDVSGAFSAQVADEDVVFFRRPTGAPAPIDPPARPTELEADRPSHPAAAPIAPDPIVTLQSAALFSEPLRRRDDDAPRPGRFDDSVAAPEVRGLLEPHAFLRALVARDPGTATDAGERQGAEIELASRAPQMEVGRAATASMRARTETAQAYESPTPPGDGQVGRARKATAIATVAAFGTAVLLASLFVARASVSPGTPVTASPGAASAESIVTASPSLPEAPTTAAPPPQLAEEDAVATTAARLPAITVQADSGAAAPAPSVPAKSPAPSPPRGGATVPPPRAAHSGSSLVPSDPFIDEFRSVLDAPGGGASPSRSTPPASSRPSAASSAALPDDFKMIH